MGFGGLVRLPSYPKYLSSLIFGPLFIAVMADRGHSHGGVGHGGHDEEKEEEHAHAHVAHGHSHDDVECHGHGGHDEEEEEEEHAAHGHSHDYAAHGHSHDHAAHGHSHDHAAHGHSHDGGDAHPLGSKADAATAAAAAAAPAAAHAHAHAHDAAASDTHCGGCITGTFLDATPPGGSVIELAPGMSAYVARGSGPGAAAASRAAIVLCTDIFGYELPNIRALALQLAEASGADVLVPDIVGDSDACAAEGFDFSTLPAWFNRHGDAQTRPRVEKAIALVKAAGKDRVMTLGFCWGARFALLAGGGGGADAWAVAHPTKTAPADYAAIAAMGVPGLFLLAETDGMFPKEKVGVTSELASAVTLRQVK